MIYSLELTNFKGFSEAAFPLKPLTFLVGANGSGKSNVFDAIRFLQGVGLGMTLSEIIAGRWEGGREVWSPIRGAPDLIHHGAASFQILSAWADASWIAFHKIEVAFQREPHVINEAVFNEDRSIVDSESARLESKAGVRPGGVLRVGLRRSGRGRDLAVEYANHRSVLGQIHADKALHKDVLQYQAFLLDSFRRALWLELNPSQMRGYVSKQVQELGLQGQNLSAVLWRLCQHADEKERVLDWLGEICAPEISDLGFVETDLGDVMLKLREGGGEWTSARSLSDGTLRFLGLLVALRTAPEDATLLIEEIDNGLHPSRIAVLIELLTNYTTERRIQVIATTHSPYLLAQLSREQLKDSLLLAREPGEAFTRVQPIGGLPHLDEVLERSGFEHLFTTRWLERAL